MAQDELQYHFSELWGEETERARISLGGGI
jgi:hypothetical protein